jgi:hypothetical protein
MDLKESVELLEQAAGELSVLIAAYNSRLKKQITNQTETEPDYMDMQTCHELQLLANSITVPEDVISYFGCYLIDNHEDRFEGGENQIQELSCRVLESFKAKQDA